MRELLHDLQEDDVVRLNGRRESVWFTQTNHNRLRREVVFHSNKEIVSTPRSVDLYVPRQEPLKNEVRMRRRPIRELEQE